MPGMVFHMIAYATAGRQPVLAALNDLVAITGCVRWEETHDRLMVEPLWDFLRDNDAADVRHGMEHHLLVDEALHGPGTPLHPSILRVADSLNHMAGFQPLHREDHGRLAELIVETSLDGLVGEANENRLNIISDSLSNWDTELVSTLLGTYFRRPRNMFRQAFDLLRDIDPRSITCIDGIAAAWTVIHRSAIKNLSRLEPQQSFKPWYDYLTGCFSSDDLMKALRELEKSARTELEPIKDQVIAALIPAIAEGLHARGDF